MPIKYAIAFMLISCSSFGLDNDGDGINDRDDPYPNDPSRPFQETSISLGSSNASFAVGDYYQTGSEFAFYITNNSLVSISLTSLYAFDGVDVCYDKNNDGLCDRVITSTTSQSLLGGDGVLDPSESVGIKVTLGSDRIGPVKLKYWYVNPEDGTAEWLEASFPIQGQVNYTYSQSFDTDGDGLGNVSDTDDDNDGVPDNEDAFPLDDSESIDSDLDGVGDNSDLFPLDPSESLDTDLDGIGNNVDTDDDGDDIQDIVDADPLISAKPSVKLVDLSIPIYSMRSGGVGLPFNIVLGYGGSPSSNRFRKTVLTTPDLNEGMQGTSLSLLNEPNMPAFIRLLTNGVDDELMFGLLIDGGGPYGSGFEACLFSSIKCLDYRGPSNYTLLPDLQGYQIKDIRIVFTDLNQSSVYESPCSNVGCNKVEGHYKLQIFASALLNDIDADGLDDRLDSDSDNDGIPDLEDEYPLDSDNDGMPTTWEIRYGLDPNDPSDASSDQDNDGVSAYDEFIAGTIPAGSLDIDGNGQYDALTDGLLLLRGMFLLSGDPLISDAVASDAVYKTSEEIASRINILGDLVDIDDNGSVDALTDGLVILRYLFNLRGDVLINDVIASDATVKMVDDVEAKIKTLMPAM